MHRVAIDCMETLNPSARCVETLESLCERRHEHLARPALARGIISDLVHRRQNP